MERLRSRAAVPPWVWHEHRARYQFAASYVANRTVVDGACGNGFGAETFVEHGAAYVVACDRSAEPLRECQRRLHSTKVHVMCCDVTALPLPDRSFDVCVALEMLEHLHQPQKFLTEAARVLTLDGVLICSTPNRLVTNPGSVLTDRPLNVFHVREYAPEELVALLRTTFGRVMLYGQNPLSWQYVHLLTRVSRRLAHPLPGRLHRLSKLPRFLLDSPGRHAVQPMSRTQAYEYLLAVCQV